MLMSYSQYNNHNKIHYLMEVQYISDNLNHILMILLKHGRMNARKPKLL
jgi:hypothetical protein